MILKIFVSAIVTALASELCRRSVFLAALLISLPLTSLLVLFFASREGASADKLAQISMGVFWMVIPSLVFFPLFAQLIQRGISFTWSLLLTIVVTVIVYHLWLRCLGLFGVSLD
jgi:uncharacterized membrane protein (GlpM family)